MDAHMRRRLGGVGLLFIALFIVSGSLIQQKSPQTSATSLAAFYAQHRGALNIEAHLTGLAVFIGIGFFWYLRELIASTPAARRLANLGFAGVLIFAVSGALSAGLQRALGDVATHASPDTIQTLHIFSVEVADVLAGGGVAVFLVATGIAVTLDSVLPRWLGWLGIPLGVLALVAPSTSGLFAGVWTLLASIILLFVNRNTPRVSERATAASVPAT